MNGEILLVSSDIRSADGLKTELQRRFGKGTFRADVAYHLDGAKLEFDKDRHRLIIAAAELPPDANNPTVFGEYLGVKFLLWVQEQCPELHSIIFTEIGSSALNAAVDKLKASKLRTGGLGLYADVVDTAAFLLSGKQEQTPLYLNLVIRATSGFDRWTYEISGEGFDFTGGSGVLRFDDRKLNQLLKESRIIDNRPEITVADIREELAPFGERLVQDLFKNDVDFWADLMKGLTYVNTLDGKDDGIAKLKICFQIEGGIHPLFFEALYSKDAKRKFWMLDAPIFRMMNGFTYSSQTPVFSCTTPSIKRNINCLIIESDTSGPTQFYNDKHERFSLLPLVWTKAECNTIYELLYANRSQFGVEQIIPVKDDLVPKGGSFLGTLRSTITNGPPFHLIHYSGHSYYDAISQKGYLFFPPAVAGDLPEAIEISEFAALLNGARFLFLSSCQSSSIDFLEAFARCKIPAAIGFRKGVVEGHAGEYSEYFYKVLLGEVGDDGQTNSGRRHMGCLQHAFLAARAKMYIEHPREWIWANPILLLQTAKGKV